LKRKKLLFESKYKFFENQLNQSKKDLAEYQKKFETTLETLQKKALLDKEKYENSAKNSINTIKSKYQIEIKDLTDNQQKLHNDLIQINKEIEEEVDGLNKLFDNQEKMRGELNYIHEKLTELLEINDGLKNELDRVKSDRDSKLNDLIMSFSGEKENLKGKILELIKKNSENERKKGKNFNRF